MKLEPVEPEGWEPPSGYSNGMIAPPGARLVFVAGQIAWDADQVLVGKDDFAAQFRQALANVLAVVDAAGGEPSHLASLTVFVKDKRAYLAEAAALGAAYREVIGRHYPAMTAIQVGALIEDAALVEIEATAVVPFPQVADRP